MTRDAASGEPGLVEVRIEIARSGDLLDLRVLKQDVGHSSLTDAVLYAVREGARYRGEVEPIDPVAGHIPGAVNHCWQQNLDVRGCFHDDDTLRRQLTQAAGGEPGAGTVYYCGSGVSACHNILAHCLAGWPEPVLFPGSWSEWCRDSGRQVIIGDDPGALAKQVDRDH